MYPVISQGPGKADDTQNRADKLGNDGCQSRAADTETKYAYEQQVQ